MHTDKPRMTEFAGARWARLVAATGLTLCLMINIDRPRIEIKRLVRR
jgi:hypothetical protein